jgi:hypothetical protein
VEHRKSNAIGMSFDRLSEIESVLDALVRLEAEKGSISFADLGEVTKRPLSPILLERLEDKPLDIHRATILCDRGIYILRIKVLPGRRR